MKFILNIECAYYHFKSLSYALDLSTSGGLSWVRLLQYVPGFQGASLLQTGYESCMKTLIYAMSSVHGMLILGSGYMASTGKVILLLSNLNA